MTIRTSGPNGPRIESPVPARGGQPVQRASDETPSQDAPAVPARAGDVLDLSPAARAFVARADEGAPLPAERLLEIRQRVLDGAYDTVEVLDSIAAKLLRSGDLR